MKPFLTIDNINLEGKIVCVRADLNSPVLKKEAILSKRIEKTCDMLKELVQKEAKIILIAHQGRSGDKDFISLKSHRELIEKTLKMKIDFSKEIYDKIVFNKVKKLKAGQILLLENLRFFNDELNFEKIKPKENKIQKLVSLCDYYILDCFSVSHRDHYSISRINGVEIICGRNFENELMHLKKLENLESQSVFLIGGNKPEDMINLVETSLKNKKVDKILLGGVIGECALIAKGFKLGIKEAKLVQEHFEIIDRLKELYSKFSKKLFAPKDVVLESKDGRIEINVEDISRNMKLLEKYEVQDIGDDTINYFEDILSKAKTIYVKGTVGNFEEVNFEKGTKALFTLISKLKKPYKIIGGGHGVSAAKMFNILNKFDYVSLSGGALAKFLEGKSLFGVEKLYESYDNYSKKTYDFIVSGSNTIDFKVDVPLKFSEIEMGSKVSIKENFKMGAGGGGVNMSICLSKLNNSVAYLGKVSQEYKDILLDELQRNKIDLIKTVETKKAVAKSILFQTKDKDRFILGFPGQNALLDPKDFSLQDIKTNNLIIGGYAKKSFKTIFGTIKKLKRKNKNLKVSAVGNKHFLKEKTVSKLLSFCEVFICNFDEAREFTKKRDIKDCLEEIKKTGVKIVVITDGAQGAYVYDGKEQHFEEAHHPKKIVDTTGAGDCFASTFLFFYSKSYDLECCLKYASKNASHFITKNGTQNGLLTFNEIEKEMKHLKD